MDVYVPMSTRTFCWFIFLCVLAKDKKESLKFGSIGGQICCQLVKTDLISARRNSVIILREKHAEGVYYCTWKKHPR